MTVWLCWFNMALSRLLPPVCVVSEEVYRPGMLPAIPAKRPGDIGNHDGMGSIL
jgi:hypothetical protein